MPSKNSLKEFHPDSMYHIYNRGVDKRIIFTDERDYAVFLSFLKFALLSDEDNYAQNVINISEISASQRYNLRRQGLANRIELVSFCLMPNHFHLLLFQHDQEAITTLMRSVCTAYVIYFNRRHKRSGRLFQGVYKASRIDSDSYWDHISRYIHLNPLDINKDYKTYPYSSYRTYIHKADAEWVRPEKCLDSFKTTREYEKFVDGYVPYRHDLKELAEIIANANEI